VSKRLRRACVALLAFTIAAWGMPSSASELRRATVASAALGRDMRFIVYIPDGYETGAQRYPVLYLLHGAGGDENAWVERGDIQTHADKLIAEGTIPPTLIVMPGCRACWWIDGGKDRAETAFWSELVPAVAERFRTYCKLASLKPQGRAGSEDIAAARIIAEAGKEVSQPDR